jgi:4-carboxymuconolactone decarboxylase
MSRLLNDDVLFGEVWAREDKLSLKLRSIVTISVFMGKGSFDIVIHRDAYSNTQYHVI